MRIFPEKILHRHEGAAIAEREAIFGAAIVARAPSARDEGFQLLD
jgi:hypothetical protein